MGKAKYTFLQIIVFLLIVFKADAQPGTSIELKKPEKYENRTLNSEKTGEKKFHDLSSCLLCASVSLWLV